MELAFSYMIKDIDAYAVNTLGIPEAVLIKRSGAAVARAVRELTPTGGSVVILAGKGNNGADGYAAAISLLSEYSVYVLDVFSAGQRSEGGKAVLAEFLSLGGKILMGTDEEKILSADCIVDAVLGTGSTGAYSSPLPELIKLVNRSRARKVAVDLPLGVNADDGSVGDFAISVDITVALSYVKPGLISYPAKAYTGRVVCDTLDLPRALIKDRFKFTAFSTDSDWAKRSLPSRPDNSNKGSFGKILLITGSDTYRGAAHLTLEAALRGGAGLVSYAGQRELSDELRSKFPEAIYLSAERALGSRFRATLVGSGSGCGEGTAETARALLSSEGGALVLDADALNSLARFGGVELIKASPRSVILTPHPLELARLIGKDADCVQAHRIETAREFARENKCILLLKGAATLVTDGEELYVNTAGSSALAKGGSGDVLAGLLTSMLGYMDATPGSVALAAYIHALAGDNLAKTLSSFGVTPSDLPRECARVISELET